MLTTLQKKASEISKSVAEGASNTQENIQARYNAAKQAKVLLDEGGAAQEARLIGKKTSVDAIANHHTLVMTSMVDTIEWLKVASIKCREARTLGESECTNEEMDTFHKLEVQYSERAKMLEEMQKQLAAEMPHSPALDRVQQDAVSMLQAKGKYSVIGNRPNVSTSTPMATQGVEPRASHFGVVAPTSHFAVAQPVEEGTFS